MCILIYFYSKTIVDSAFFYSLETLEAWSHGPALVWIFVAYPECLVARSLDQQRPNADL